MNVLRLTQKKDENPDHANLAVPEVKAPEVQPSPSSALPAASGRANILWPLPGVSKPSSEMATATTAFRNNLARNWKFASAPEPRGSLIVSGLVEIEGPQGVCVMDVHATYHPQLPEWVTVAMGVRRIGISGRRSKGSP